jgi:hypothetical protein
VKHFYWEYSKFLSEHHQIRKPCLPGNRNLQIGLLSVASLFGASWLWQEK